MLVVVLLALGFMPITKGEVLAKFCDDYTANTTYHENLLRLSTTLQKDTSSTPFLFAKGSVGAYPDAVYGLARCLGDANASVCSDCIRNAFESAQQLCSNNREVTIFYDTCLLSFSNWNSTIIGSGSYGDNSYYAVIDTMDKTGNTECMLPGWEASNITNAIQVILLQETSNAAAYMFLKGRVVTGFMEATSTNPPLNSMAQCTPDMSSLECWNCLEYISRIAIGNFTGQQRGQVLSLRCNLRYDTAVFYSGAPMWRITPPVVSVTAPAQGAMPSPKHKRRMSKVLVISIVVPLFATFLCLIISFGLNRRYRKALNENVTSKTEVGLSTKHTKGKDYLQDKANKNLKDEALIWEGRALEFKVYDFSQVRDATSNFSERNKLGEGGFGPVYKGQLSDGLEIAVKRLASRSMQGFTEFKNEIELIAKLQHTNLVRLLGCCCQGEEKILIYEYLPNKSLDFFIFDPTRRYIINWAKRLAIIEGIAQGMLYLHKHSRLRVIHRDLKASNILLDRKMIPKISDFGLAKIFSTNATEGNTNRVAGTYGYMAPEYASEGLFSIKSDVFSFGVLLLEIVSGKRTSKFNGYGDFINLLGHAWQSWKDGLWLQLVDASLVTDCHTVQMMRCINIALLCVQENATDRPIMSDVVAMLTTESMTLPEPKHPAYFHIRVGNQDVSAAVEPSSSNDVTVSLIDGR